jgi:GTP-binding protein Era
MTQISKNKIFKCGFVSIVGRPNVGKSTLVNSILRSDISIVTRKPQTTRNRILGIYTMSEYQAIFVDTPGIHVNEKKAINRVMNKTAINAMMDTNLNLFVCDSSYWSEEDEIVLNQLKNARSPSILLLNKIDLIHPKDKLLELISTLSNKHDFSEVIPIMAKNRDSLKSLLSIIPKFLPNSPQLYESEMITDRSRIFITSEKIREKLILQLNQEIPYGLSVEIDKFSDDAKQITIDAMIWVEKNGQKGIVVGKNGSTLKKIGTSARLDLKNYFKKNIHLNLWVKVKSNWADSKKELIGMGFDI